MILRGPHFAGQRQLCSLWGRGSFAASGAEAASQPLGPQWPQLGKNVITLGEPLPSGTQGPPGPCALGCSVGPS